MSHNLKQPKLSADKLRTLLEYNPCDGSFVWTGNRYPDGRRRRIRAHGEHAGSLFENGYLYISIDRYPFLAHRLAWLYVKGHFPESQIDHRDLNKTNNRFTNLRRSTELGNSGNRGPNKNNRCGFKGVFRGKQGRWMAQISINGVHTHLGVFDDPKNAARAYDSACLLHFGEFAKTNKMLGLLG